MVCQDCPPLVVLNNTFDENNKACADTMGENRGGLGAVGAVLWVAQRYRCYILYLACGHVIFRNVAASSSINNIGVREDPARRSRIQSPQPDASRECDSSVVAPTRNAN